MIQIENISVNEKYSISLWFNKDYTKENFIFGKEKEKQEFFRNRNIESYEIVNKKRTFGEIIENGLAFAESNDLHIVRNSVYGLVSVLKQGRGVYEIEPYKVEIFRIYNSTDNVLEQYVILKLWHEFLVQHKEVNSIANTMRRKQWEQIGILYGEFADRMLMPFEKKFISAEAIKTCFGQTKIETLVTEKNIDCIFTFEEDILPLYIMYLTELSRRGKHILNCEICGRQFVAARKDTKVCGSKCKAQRQAGYFQEHKEKVKEDMLDKIYQQNRDGYDNFLKKLDKLNTPDEIVAKYKQAKYDFLSEGKKKRKAYRNGGLKKSELSNWISIDRMKRIKLEADISSMIIDSF